MNEDLKVLFHIDNAEVQGEKMIRLLNNQLNNEPETRVKLIVSGLGIELVKKGWLTPTGTDPYRALVDLKARNVTIDVCTYAMGVRGITEEDLHEDLVDTWIPSASGRISKLQIQENYAYYKP